MLYLGGFDAASQSGPVWHNTAWIYRAELPDPQPRLAPRPAGMTVSVDTVAGWRYRLQASPDLRQWPDRGPPLEGDNRPQTVEVGPSAGVNGEFFRWGVERP